MSGEIMVILPHSTDLEAVAAIFHSHGHGFVVVNPPMSMYIAPGDWCISPTPPKFDDDQFEDLGIFDGLPYALPTYERELKKLRRWGWSDAKIQRWLTQKLKNDQDRYTQEQKYIESPTPNQKAWVDFITHVLTSGHTRSLALLICPKLGRLVIVGRQRIRLAELNAQYLGKMKEGTLYEFIP